jgi:hypothetical protein
LVIEPPTLAPQRTSAARGFIEMKLSKFESAIRLALAYNKAFNRHDVLGMMQLIDDCCVFESTGPAPHGTVYSGKKAITQFYVDLFRKSPMAHMEVDQIFGFGIRCVVQWRYDGNDAEGAERFVRGVDIVQVSNELICEILSYAKG